ncbi:SpoVA/SpoVAEb family sporulation membrane protein, partial [Ruminococcus bicirculans (ex Wegman et al. 2014)]
VSPPPRRTKAHSRVSKVREQIDKIGFLGIFTGGLTASAAGITAAMTFAFIFSLFFKSSAKE